MRTSITGTPLRLQAERVQGLGDALGALPADVYLAIDRAEPEWPVLERLASPDAPAGVLAGLALALSDFQLGAGGATRYWREVQAVLDEQGALRTTDDVARLMTAVLARPVNARLRPLKRDRIHRLLGSHLPGRLHERSLAGLGQQPMALWHDLATTMGQMPQAKTVAFAMKVFDLLHCIATGQYVAFPSQVPIVADLRIARVSFSSGLLLPPSGQPVAVAMAHGGEYASAHTGEIIGAWAQVAEQAHGVSLFRVDSLIWQVAESIYQHRDDRQRAAGTVERVVEHFGADRVVAAHLEKQLTCAL